VQGEKVRGSMPAAGRVDGGSASSGTVGGGDPYSFLLLVDLFFVSLFWFFGFPK
jgi:hypothetical protein